MKLDDKLLEDISKELIGDDSVALISYIKTKKNVSELKIAEELKLTINQVRNILYRFHEHNLVSFIRKKDKKKGWYVYYWTFNPNEARDAILMLKRKQLGTLKHQHHKALTEIYLICPKGHVTYNFETALEHDFKCPECGEVLVQKDRAKELVIIQNKIKKLEQEIEKLELIPRVEVKVPSVKKKVVKRKRKKPKKVKKKLKKKKKPKRKKPKKKRLRSKKIKKKPKKRILKKRKPKRKKTSKKKHRKKKKKR